MKGTRLCNLRCSYCHDWRSGPGNTMSDEILEQSIKSILSNSSNRVIEFIWHGGEPTLLPISHYQKIVTIQSKYRRNDQLILNRLQTNGTRLNRDWVQFIKNNGFGIGISIDGPPKLHDRQRVYPDGKGSFDKVQAAIKLLQEENIQFMVLMVIDKLGLEVGASAIFEFFNRLKIKNYGLLAATPINKADTELPFSHYVNPSEFTKFLIDIYNCWINQSDFSIRIRELDDLVRLIHGKTSRTCTLNGSCFGSYFIIEPDGQVAHCELFQGDSKYTIGNILKEPFEVLQRSSHLIELNNENETSVKKMIGCEHFKICKGWCPHERYLSEQYDSSFDSKCCGLADLISHIKANPPAF